MRFMQRRPIHRDPVRRSQHPEAARDQGVGDRKGLRSVEHQVFSRRSNQALLVQSIQPVK